MTVEASTPPRVWMLELLQRPPTMNKRQHHMAKAAETKVWRDLAYINHLNAVRAGRAPQTCGAISVTARQGSKDRRWLQDLGNAMPAVKAAIDGLVDAGLIPDDTQEFVKHIGFSAAEIVGHDSLRLYIREVRP